MYEVGLTLGKFAPFHRGHGFLVETALGECRHLIVIVYEARRSTDIPLAIRAGWIRSLYPMAEVLEAPGAPEERGDSPGIRMLHEDFLLRYLAGRRIDVFFSSEDYGEQVGRLLGCANRVIDKARVAVPVSATMVRDDPEALRAMVDPIVWADLRQG